MKRREFIKQAAISGFAAGAVSEGVRLNPLKSMSA
jgi:hypothetical protein